MLGPEISPASSPPLPRSGLGSTSWVRDAAGPLAAGAGHAPLPFSQASRRSFPSPKTCGGQGLGEAVTVTAQPCQCLHAALSARCQARAQRASPCSLGSSTEITEMNGCPGPGVWGRAQCLFRVPGTVCASIIIILRTLSPGGAARDCLAGVPFLFLLTSPPPVPGLWVSGSLGLWGPCVAFCCVFRPLLRCSGPADGLPCLVLSPHPSNLEFPFSVRGHPLRPASVASHRITSHPYYCSLR